MNLDGWDNEINQYQPKEGGRSGPAPFPLPDGTYQAVIIHAYMEELGNAKKPAVIFEMRTLGQGPQIACEFKKICWLTTQQCRGFTWQDLAMVGVQTQNWRDVPAALDEVRDMVMNVTVRTTEKEGKRFTNVYFDERVTAQTPPESQSVTPTSVAEIDPRDDPSQAFNRF